MLRKDQVHQGDCLELLQAIPPNSVHLAFADPPFNIGYKYDVYDDRKQAEDYLQWSQNWICGIHRVLRANGTFWLAIGDEFAAELKLIAQNTAGFHCRSWVIWYYTFGVNCKNGFSRSHTHLFHFVKNPYRFTFNSHNPAVRIPSARQLVYADGRANPRGRLPDNTWFIRPQDLPGGLPLEHDTWYFPRVAGTFKEREGFHGCQMPEQLLGRIIRVSSKVADVVLDPFAGSGTTLCVAKKLGRRYLGIELSPEYARHIEKRLLAAGVGDPLDGPENPGTSAPPTSQGKQRRGFVRGGGGLTTSPKTVELLIQAFTRSNAGRSADQVIASPELNQAFIEACSGYELPGNPAAWNCALLQIRKRGGLPPADRNLAPPAVTEDLLSASEIALQQMTVDTGLSVDSVLCDPELASLFDELASRFAPGFNPFDYRWAALSLRKSLRKAKRAAAELEPATEPPGRQEDLIHGCSLEGLPKGAVYVLEDSQGLPLYVGSTLGLAACLRAIRRLDAWTAVGVHRFQALSVARLHQRIAVKTALAQRLRPLLNYVGYWDDTPNSAA